MFCSKLICIHVSYKKIESNFKALICSQVQIWTSWHSRALNSRFTGRLHLAFELAQDFKYKNKESDTSYNRCPKPSVFCGKMHCV